VLESNNKPFKCICEQFLENTKVETHPSYRADYMNKPLLIAMYRLPLMMFATTSVHVFSLLFKLEAKLISTFSNY